MGHQSRWRYRCVLILTHRAGLVQMEKKQLFLPELRATWPRKASGIAASVRKADPWSGITSRIPVHRGDTSSRDLGAASDRWNRQPPWPSQDPRQSGAAKHDQRNFRRHTEAHRRSDGAETSIYIESCGM